MAASSAGPNRHVPNPACRTPCSCGHPTRLAGFGQPASAGASLPRGARGRRPASRYSAHRTSKYHRVAELRHCTRACTGRLRRDMTAGARGRARAGAGAISLPGESHAHGAQLPGESHAHGAQYSSRRCRLIRARIRGALLRRGSYVDSPCAAGRDSTQTNRVHRPAQAIRTAPWRRWAARVSRPEPLGGARRGVAAGAELLGSAAT